jgi:hypothetical protein
MITADHGSDTGISPNGLSNRRIPTATPATLALYLGATWTYTGNSSDSTGGLEKKIQRPTELAKFLCTALY